MKHNPKTIEFLRKFCYGSDLGPFEIDELKAAGYIAQNLQDRSWFVTHAGHVALQQTGPLALHVEDGAVYGRLQFCGEGSTQCPDDDDDDDSYLPPKRWNPKKAPAILESDPHGKDQHETGAKLDAGKPRLGLVLGAFANALVEVGKVGTYGANKYTDNGWLDVPNGKARYTDALLRHILAETDESHDPDTNLHHAAHAAWNALARLELILRLREVNQ